LVAILATFLWCDQGTRGRIERAHEAAGNVRLRWTKVRLKIPAVFLGRIEGVRNHVLYHQHYRDTSRIYPIESFGRRSNTTGSPEHEPGKRKFSYADELLRAPVELDGAGTTVVADRVARRGANQ